VDSRAPKLEEAVLLGQSQPSNVVATDAPYRGNLMAAFDSEEKNSISLSNSKDK